MPRLRKTTCLTPSHRAAPEHGKQAQRLASKKRVFVALLLSLAANVPALAANIRVASWNVTNYSSGRSLEFQTAIYGQFNGRSLAPDILIGQEFLSATAVASFLSILNTAPGSPGDWSAAPFVDGPDTDSAFFYRTTAATLAADLSPSGVTVVAAGGVSPNHPRHIMRYDIILGSDTPVESRIAIYSTHMKSGATSEDQARRLLEAQRIRDDAELLPPEWSFIIGGDFNVQSSNQAAYQELVGTQANNAGRFIDPIATPGSWNNNAAFRFVHTQDPIGAGGMDDRHDQLLFSADFADGVGIEYVGDPLIPYSTTTWDDSNHSYRCWGNDGSSFNAALTITSNQLVGPIIAQALADSAQGGGHLPVFLDIELPTVLEVPATSPNGLLVMMVLLSAASVLVVRKR